MSAKRRIRLRPKPGKRVRVVSKAEGRRVQAQAKKRGVRTPRIVHDLEVNYEGTSMPVNSNPSKTRIPVEEFGSKPDSVLTIRVESILKPLRRKYGKKVFKRGNIDAGALKRAGWKGRIVHVGGDPATEDCRFRLR